MNHESNTLSRLERLTALAHIRQPDYSFRDLDVTLEELGTARRNAPYTAFTREFTDFDGLALALTIEEACGVTLYQGYEPAPKRARLSKAFTATSRPTGHVFMGVLDEAVLIKEGYISVKIGASKGLASYAANARSAGPGAFTYLATWPSQDHFALVHLTATALRKAGYVKAGDTRQKFLLPAPLVADLQKTSSDTTALGRFLELQLVIGAQDGGYGLGDCVSDARGRDFARKN